jgi:hypothetical protein
VRSPSTPRGWLRWAAYVVEAQGRPFSPRLDGIPRGDPRLRDSRETALSVKILLERASAACTRNGVGYELLVRFYLGDASWHSFTESEQAIIAKTARAFARLLCEAEFLPPKG